MKYVQINTVPNGSTGGIMMKLHYELLSNGIDSHVFWGRGRQGKSNKEMRFATNFQVMEDILQTRMFGRAGFYSKRSTHKLIRALNKLNLGPEDVVHLHNLHGYYVNIEMLFRWLSEQSCKVKWTLHDCWAFTGHCSHFLLADCYLWESPTGCNSTCPQINAYPKTCSRKSVKWCFDNKRRVVLMIPPERMTIITVSEWLAAFVRRSYLSPFEIEVHHNTVDGSIFHFTYSTLREQYGIEDRHVILGVATTWSDEKGLSDFIRLSQDLDDGYAIVLIGLSNSQVKALPTRSSCKVIGLPRTESQIELAKWYSTADKHIQPSIQETFGMTVLEALSCGTHVVVRKGSACVEACVGFPEELIDIIDYDYDALLRAARNTT